MYCQTGHSNRPQARARTHSHLTCSLWSLPEQVRFWGLQKLHPFDSCKYEKIVAALTAAGVLNDAKGRSYVEPPAEASQEQLLAVHTPRYLETLNSSSVVAGLCEMPPLAILPNSTLHSKMLRPMRFAVQGTIMAGELALRHGWAINMGGGMHHASADDGGGWCVYADIFLSLHNVRPKIERRVGRAARAMIVDLDVHQGNGLALDKERFHGGGAADGTKGAAGKGGDKGGRSRGGRSRGDGSVYILDMFNHTLWPRDVRLRGVSDRAVRVVEGEDDERYLDDLERALRRSFAEFEPDIVYYNAGTDILAGDPLNGGVCVSRAGVARRDEMVFDMALSRGIPIVMVLSGGYAADSARSVWESVSNLVDGATGLLRCGTGLGPGAVDYYGEGGGGESTDEDANGDGGNGGGGETKE